jgi:hypothetical protein
MDDRDDESACTRLVTRFSDCLDERRHEDLVGLTTPDCVWASGSEVVGHDAIRARLAARPASRKTLHLVTNLVVDLLSPTSATARCCILVYRFDAPFQPPSPLTAPRVVAHCRDELVKQEGRWLIARREMVALAERPD